MATQGNAPPKTNMRRFVLKRVEDETGVSGTGIVAEGVEFSHGMCAVTWLTPYRCVNVYESIKTVEAVHGHNGKTLISWLDEACTPETHASLMERVAWVQCPRCGKALR